MANAAGRAHRDESDLLVIVRSSVAKDLAAYVTLISGSIHLNEESIGIPELKRFLVPARLRLQIARLQLRDYVVGVETGDSEVVVVERRRVALLVNSKEALAYAQDMGCCRMLLEGHPKEFLVKLRRALEICDPHGNVIQAHRAQARLLWRSLGARNQRGEGSGELAARQAAAFEISDHSFYDELHTYPFSAIRNCT